MFCSDLAKSVFDQTKLEYIPTTMWWVESMLQKLKIIGLVKMINSSKKIDLQYISGYLPRYKWANRSDGLDISSSYDTWYILCTEYFDDYFPWIAWQDMVLMNNQSLLLSSIKKSLKSNVRHMSYLSKIYVNCDIDVVSSVTIPNVLQLKSDTISEIKAGDWFEIRKHIA
jgi:hypothetical protein